MARKSKSKGPVAKAVAKVPGLSSNPMTNLLVADIAMRGGGRIMRHAIETLVLGAKYSPTKAKNIVKGRSMAQTLIGTAIARIATRSVPGAILVGGGILAKTLYDRTRSPAASEAAGEEAIAEQAQDGRKKKPVLIP